jgi:hypothetical protein
VKLKGSIPHLIAKVTFSGGPKTLQGELIPQARYCSKVGRTARIVLQLAPQFHNVIVDAATARIDSSVAANFFQQLCACDEAIRILDEKL